MKRIPKFLRILIPILLVVGVLALLINTVVVDFLVKMFWYDSVGYLEFMFLKMGYKYIVLVGVTLFFFVILFLNFWVASRYLGVTKFHKESKVKQVIQGFRSGSMKVYTPVALLLAIPLALPIFREWENFLLFFYAPNTGNADALFGLDVTFYLFALPIIKLVYGRLLICLFLMLLGLVILYAAELKVLSKDGQRLYHGAKMHLSIVVMFIFIALATGYGIEALMLQYTTKNMDLFYGPGFTEFYVQLPLIGLAAFMMLPLAFSIIALIFRQKGFKVVVVFLVLAVTAHFFKGIDPLFASVNRVIVKPNELAKQSPFIKQTIDSTLTAYQLKNVTKRIYEQKDVNEPFEANSGYEQLENVPLWDNELLMDVYQQLQAMRPYYQFTGVDAARYMIEGDLHQVYLSGREITTSLLPDGAQNWINQRLKYTHGYGLVMTPAAQVGEEQVSWFISNMPPESKVGFEVNRPSIYYGLADLEYVIAPNKSREFHYPGGEDGVSVSNDYEGTGGVLISNLFKKALFALYFQDWNVLLTNQTLPTSRIHFLRNVVDRIEELTPFLQLDDNPYLVVTPDRLYWIVDAYTTSVWYPNSQPFQEDLNYIRNSVKIVVDAYEGSVEYYLSDPTDPIALAYQRMYPKLIKSLDDMPKELRAQIRYPRNLFDIQMRMYAVYHQENPETYYQSEDELQFAEISHQDSLIKMRPYYITLDLIEPGKREFLLLTPLLPINRDNLRALGVVRSNAEHYGEIVFYTFPKGSQVYGPPQINALIDQNTDIAQSITLWNQQGSEVKRGKMIIIPIDKRIIYIQPFYMEASVSPRIPQLKRVIVSTEGEVVMDISVEKALQQLLKKVSKNRDPLADDGEFVPVTQPVVN
ncbi:UPF0182 family protein [Kiritimatiellota bacterium B12222]|nr:UPF0182 family protein [Kiritimatiellota bacterium B12222]